MAPIIFRPCYCTREQVRRAVEVTLAEYAYDRIDRAILTASEAVEALTQRKFYPETATRKFDWPNYQYTYPWKLYLDENELADIPTAVVTGSLLPVPVTIPIPDVICQPVNTGPPYTRIELRRDLSVAFGYNSTPQEDIAITGTFGYWTKTESAGVLAADVAIVDTAVTVSDGSVGVGDLLIAGSERMIVTDAAYADTGVAYSGLSSASAADKIVAVPDGTAFSKGEILMVDAEWLLVEYIAGNNLVVKRAFEGSVLAAHAGGTLWASRTLTVIRGALGTIVATHKVGDALTASVVPGLIRQLSIAEAIVWLAQEHGAYGGASGPLASAGGPSAGPGLPDLRERVCNSRFSRAARTRVA